MTAARIQRLSRDLVNKIAAGEVVERPASVVKELVENAIDAEASRMDVVLEDGGKKLIRVSDDGVGMSPADLLLAFESHATSKIGHEDDLYDIHTLGFRGEALASIASVSRCQIVSRPRGSREGATVESAAGKTAPLRVCGAPEGTLVEVRDLFYSMPARLKFLRSTATELRHAAEAVTRLALPHHAVAFTLTHKNKPVLSLPACETPRERTAAVFGESFCERLLSVHAESAALSVTGFVSPPGEGLARQRQYVFLNGRYIRDRAVSRAIAEAYRGRLMRGRYPGVFLNLGMDPSRVDVNVHPTKVEVRFRDPGAVFAQIMAALEKALRSAEPSAVAVPPPARPAGEAKESVRQAIAGFFDRDIRREEHPSRPRQFPTAKRVNSSPLDMNASPVETAPTHPPEREEAVRPPFPEAQRAPRPAFQIHDSYIVEEVEGGFNVIDQHALHERILYDELRRRATGSTAPRQRLLVPELVDLPAEDFLRACEMRETLLRMGLEVEPFGERTIAVHAVPHLANATMNPRELLLDLLAETADAVRGRPAEREEALMRVIACKAAVKAGDRLSHARIEALLEQRRRIGPEPTCPHGRPTTLRFDLAELEKQFQRK